MNQEAYVKEVIATVKHLEEEIKRLEREIKQTKEQIHRTVVEGLEYTCDEDQQHLAWELYYRYDGTVSSVSIADGLGTNVYGLKGYLNGALLSVTCYKCHEEFRIEVASRSQVKDFAKRPQECPECEAKRKSDYEAGRALRDLENSQRQAHLDWLHTMPYKQYLQTTEWEQTRMRKLKRARFRCELCNKQGKLNVHHKTYERRGYEDDRDLIVLCGTCHAKFHDKLPPTE